MKKRVLIAGVGGASLGTEIAKCLKISGRYELIAADVSPQAYGLYETHFQESYVVSRENYASRILKLCEQHNVQAVIPGGEQPLRLLVPHKTLLADAGVFLTTNNSHVIEISSDKRKTFEHLAKLGLPSPKTVVLNTVTDLEKITYPSILKPAVESGGSVSTHLVDKCEEAEFLFTHLNAKGIKLIAQEYLSGEEGEYTVGVLHLPDGTLVGSIALQRSFPSKLSYVSNTNGRIISTGNSQGLVDEFPEVCSQAEKIATLIESTGPLNIQGRVRDGVFYPFEINPRFSASCYLRALAGFNEPELFLEHHFTGNMPTRGPIKPGYYLRSFAEQWVPKEKVEQWSRG